MKTLSRGILISVEGIDGAGKSTLVNNVVNRLTKQGYSVLGTREPGATQLGKVIREIVQKKEVPRTYQAEYLLFAADRAQHFHEIIIPALQRNMLVISDRMSDSSLVYQGYARGLSHEMITTINDWTMHGYHIDMTLYLKIDAHTAAQRLALRAQQLTVFEEKKAFTQKLIDGFQQIFTNNPRIRTLEGTRDSTQLCDDACQAIETWIEQKQLLL